MRPLPPFRRQMLDAPPGTLFKFSAPLIQCLLGPFLRRCIRHKTCRELSRHCPGIIGGRIACSESQCGSVLLNLRHSFRFHKSNSVLVWLNRLQDDECCGFLQRFEPVVVLVDCARSCARTNSDIGHARQHSGGFLPASASGRVRWVMLDELDARIENRRPLRGPRVRIPPPPPYD